MSRLVVTISALLGLTAASAVHAADWVDAGRDHGQRVALNLPDSLTRKDGPFTTTLAMVPLDWPANAHAYTLWIAEFDCRARTRTMRFRIAYSGRRDPIRTELTDAGVETDRDAAVAEQLRILCGDSGSGGMRRFNHLGEFTRAYQR